MWAYPRLYDGSEALNTTGSLQELDLIQRISILGRHSKYHSDFKIIKDSYHSLIFVVKYS